jgi:ribosome-binding protein aMBF1 (putative translation factor)
MTQSNTATNYHCELCGRAVGKRRHHIITENDRLLCLKCSEDSKNHAVIYPECEKRWHDIYDHGVCNASYASVKHADRQMGQAVRGDDLIEWLEKA